MSSWVWKEPTPMDMEEEDINLAETLRKLQIDAHRHKDDNERIIKAKEQHE
jgi:PIN domain nuclease of toxin-antitoxin system